MRDKMGERTVYSSDAKPEEDFTNDTTDVITCSAHGMSEGDLVQLTTTNTLPAGFSTSTDYYVVEDVNTNNFKLSATRGGTAITSTDAGVGTHTYHLKGRSIFVGDWRHNKIALSFTGTPTMTVKFQGSDADDAPDFNASQSDSNRWDYVEVVDTEDGTAIDGDTGVACAGTADNRSFVTNTDGLNWLTVANTAFTAGKVGIKISSYN